MNNNSNTNKEISALLSKLADDLVNLMIREHQYIHQELEHVRLMIGDATRSLTSCFDDMNILAIEQNTIITMALQLNNANSEELLDQCKRTDKRYRENQRKVVTALQFDDIVQQLTKHAQNRTMSILEMFKRLNEALNELKHLDHKDDPAFISRIMELERDVLKFRAELEKENPVNISAFSIGKTELF